MLVVRVRYLRRRRWHQRLLQVRRGPLRKSHRQHSVRSLRRRAIRSRHRRLALCPVRGRHAHERERIDIVRGVSKRQPPAGDGLGLVPELPSRELLVVRRIVVHELLGGLIEPEHGIVRLHSLRGRDLSARRRLDLVPQLHDWSPQPIDGGDEL